MPAAPPSVSLPPSARWRTLAASALLVALVVVCYWPARHGAMLWDDPAHVPRPELRDLAGLKRIWFDLGATQQYYPVLFSAFWFEHRLWGDAMTGYHLVNIALHASSCIVFALLLRRLWFRPGQPPRVPPGTEWLAAALFAAHPVCVESVAWITEQKNTLSLFFYLLAALAYFIHRERPSAGRYALATLLFLLALGSKTATVTLPAALLVVIWWRDGRLSRRDVLPLVPWFLLSATIGLLTSWVERKLIGAEGEAFDLTLPERTLLAGRVVWFYVGKLLWPADLMFFYPRWATPTFSPTWLAGIAGAAAATLALWMWRKRARAPLAVWLLFVGGLAPVLGFFNVFFFQFSYVNDHFAYLPMLAPLALIAAGLTQLPWHRAGWVGGGAIVLLCAALSFRQSGLYASNETLFRAAIASNPDAWMGHYVLGFALAKQPEPDAHAEALHEFEETLRLHPTFPDAHLSRGVELARLPGRSADAIAVYEQAIALRPQYVEAHNALGVELARTPGRLAEAIAHYERALALRPDFADAHFNLGNALAANPARRAEAVPHFRAALATNPGFARAHSALAAVLARQPGGGPEAIEHFETALRLNPTLLEAYNGLGIVYAQSGRLDLARAQWETALRIDPSFETARQNLRLLDRAAGR